MKKTIISLLLAIYAVAIAAQVGKWSGELDIQGMKIPLVFNFTKDGCTLDSPSQGAKGIKAIFYNTPDETLKVDIGMINAVFEGKMTANEIAGSFTQNGYSFPLTLRQNVTSPYRPQTPKGPFSYTTEDVIFQNGEFTFQGTLTLPKNYNKDTPVLVMVTGSGQQNRDEELMGHRPFAVIADSLANNGIATMRFDDRGWEDKNFPWQNYTIADHKSDAMAGVSLMRKRFNHVGVIGHSEGGTIALMMASEGKVDFCISLAGMFVSGKQTIIEQNYNILLNSGLPESTVDTYCDNLEKACDDVIANKNIEDNECLNVPEALRQNFKASLKQLSTRYMRDFLCVDIRETLPNIKCPVLALNGKSDAQVNYSANLDVLEKGLTSCKHEIIAFDGLNHLFQHCQTGFVNEYYIIEETIAPEILQVMTDWIKKTVSHIE